VGGGVLSISRSEEIMNPYTENPNNRLTETQNWEHDDGLRLRRGVPVKREEESAEESVDGMRVVANIVTIVGLIVSYLIYAMGY